MVHENIVKTLIVNNLPQFITKTIWKRQLPFLDLLIAI